MSRVSDFDLVRFSRKILNFWSSESVAFCHFDLVRFLQSKDLIFRSIAPVIFDLFSAGENLN